MERLLAPPEKASRPRRREGLSPLHGRRARHSELCHDLRGCLMSTPKHGVSGLALGERRAGWDRSDITQYSNTVKQQLAILDKESETTNTSRGISITHLY